MPLKPVQKILVADGILEQLRDLIHSGEFPPGEKLPPEMKLAEQLSVSRSSLREALNALVHLGYLYRQNKGLYVAPEANRRKVISFDLDRSLEDRKIAEMIEVRQIIETELCARAAKRAIPEDINLLEDILTQMRIHLHDPVAFAESNHQFHLAIAKAGKNQTLLEIIEKVRDLLKDTISKVIAGSNISKRSLDYHIRILEAIKEGNASRSRQVMAAHIADVEKEFLKILYRPDLL
ncbi:MAG: FadR/GntR family transcriptional regulator [Smithellaceae bacterium]|nr:FadR/GntR family transcriptional regulator [Smithellaceae bacterium]